MNERSVLISGIIASVAVLMAYQFIDGVIKNRIGDYEDQDVIVARVDIEQNQRITEDLYSVEAVPKRFVQSSGVQNPQFLDRKIALIPIKKGEQILKTMVVPPSETNLALVNIPVGGWRAVTIGVQDPQGVTSVGGLVQTGNYVDILLTLFYNTQADPQQNQSLGNNKILKAEVRTMFQNVRVLAVGRDFELKASPIARMADAEGQSRGNARGAASVTVALMPKQVQELILAQTLGRLALTLRRRGDDKIVELPITDAFKAFGVKQPIEQGPSPYYRDIQGGRLFRSNF